MNVSVLIPVFNYDCTQLVHDLAGQLAQGDEIIVADDGSTDKELIAQNQSINDWQGCTYWRSERNMGRSGIRNTLATMAKGDWLVFIDCDAKVENNSFLDNYRKEMGGKYEVICGGTGNLSICPSPEVTLRWKYETQSERRLTIDRRRENPYAQFTTFNFAIRKATFLRIQFSEEIKDYGHEDTKFGIDLQQGNIPLLHIENKLTHLGLEKNDIFLRKTEVSLEQLRNLPSVCNHARISLTAKRLHQYRMGWAMKLVYKLLKNWFRRNLCGTNPSLFVFNLYKLGYFISLK